MQEFIGQKSGLLASFAHVPKSRKLRRRKREPDLDGPDFSSTGACYFVMPTWLSSQAHSKALSCSWS